jgi:hypothetical protein
MRRCVLLTTVLEASSGEPPDEPTAPYSDQFNDGTLSAFWTFVDPQGDCSYTLDGATKLSITATDTSSHDLWGGANYAPRVVQDCPAGDLSVEAKALSYPDTRFSLQGILASNGNEVLRIDTYSDGSATYGFMAHIDGGSANQIGSPVDITAWGSGPVYYRLTRSGNTWTGQISANGTNWTTVGSETLADFAPNKIGVFAGSVQSNEYSGEFDWFINLNE